jgi:hypothetical protein
MFYFIRSTAELVCSRPQDIAKLHFVSYSFKYYYKNFVVKRGGENLSNVSVYPKFAQ